MVLKQRSIFSIDNCPVPVASFFNLFDLFLFAENVQYNVFNIWDLPSEIKEIIVESVQIYSNNKEKSTKIWSKPSKAFLCLAI